jgi:hypothetical protein
MNRKYLVFWFVFVFCLSIFLDSFVVYNLWEWYLVPLGVKSIFFKEAIGLRVFFGFVSYQYYSFKRDEEFVVIGAIYYLFYRPILALFVGWIINLL